MGGATAFAGGQLGKAIATPLENALGSISSPLRFMIGSEITNTTIGGLFGGVSETSQGGSFWHGAWNGAKMGMVTGTISGLGVSIQYAAKNQVDLLTGKDIKVITSTQKGQNFGKLGMVIDKPDLNISNISGHGVNQAITRGVSPSTLLNTLSNPSVVLQQSSGNYLYINNGAAVILSPSGTLISTYPSSMFDQTIINILNITK